MANSEAQYVKVDGGDDDSQRMTKSRVVILSIGGSCLALLSIIAISSFTFMAPQTSVAEPTNLLGLHSSLRSAAKPSPMVPSLASLPGGHWKDLALAGIEANNRCDSGASTKAFFKSMDRPSRDVVVKAMNKMEDLRVGQLPPFGFWDPIGFSTKLSPGKVLYYREAELKHGRVCMLAALGFFFAETYHPLFGGNIDVPSYIAFQQTPLQKFWVAVLLTLGAIEFQYSVPTFADPLNQTFAIDVNKAGRISGDLGFDPLGLKPKDPKELEAMQNRELSNGRLAMMATAGMVVQELVNGKKILDNAGISADTFK